MKLSKQVLIDLGSCEAGIKWFDEHYPECNYPDGVELFNVILGNPRPSQIFLDWGFDHLIVSDKEKKAYEIACANENCTAIFHTDHCVDCHDMISSSNCSRSSNICNSRRVDNSQLVHDSRQISNSKQVGSSQFVRSGERIYQSKLITVSIDVAGSESIVNSTGVWHSTQIVGSRFVRNCIDCEDVLFCSDCKNLKHAFFCLGVSNMEYVIFNTPVSKETYERFMLEFGYYFSKESVFSSNVVKCPDLDSLDFHFEENRIEKHWQINDDSFYEWLCALPYFSINIAYGILLNPEIFTIYVRENSR